MDLLSVDYDFFCTAPELGWHHQDSGYFYRHFVWGLRAYMAHRDGGPLPGLSPDIHGFWDRFTFSRRAKLYIAESHVYICRAARNVSRIVSFDAHHDAGYRHKSRRAWEKRGRVSCADWALALAPQATIEVVYPRWKTWAIARESKPLIPIKRRFDDGTGGRFDRVFLCRSDGWTAPWLDAGFEALVDACPVKDVIALEWIAPREWDEHALPRIIEALDAVTRSRTPQADGRPPGIDGAAARVPARAPEESRTGSRTHRG
jgi:hypothetical protein